MSSPLRIAYAYDSRSEYLNLGFTEEECAEFDSDATINAVADSLRKHGTVEMVGNIYSVVSKLAAGAATTWDIVFNYTEGFAGVGREAQVPALLEAHKVKFTLSDTAAQAICLDKCKTKMVLGFYGVPSSPFAVVRHDTYTPNAGAAKAAILSSPFSSALQTYPLFIKPTSQGSSVGVYESSKVDSADALEPTVADLMDKFAKDVVIESYLAGREFNVGVFGSGADAWVFGVVEVDFSTTALDYLSYDVKNGDTPKFKKCDMSDRTIQAVADVGLRAWKAMGCFDAGTVDIRHDVHGPSARPFVLEVNTIPGLSVRAAFPVMAQMFDIDFDSLIARMLEGGLKRAGIRTEERVERSPFSTHL